MNNRLTTLLQSNKHLFHSVVPFQPQKDNIALLNCTATNTTLQQIDLVNTSAFSEYINQTLKENNVTYLIGGYMEDRILYKRSPHFDGEENRTIHLGIDIWGEAGIKVFAPIGGTIHSFAFNNNFGDYGATIILQHTIEGLIFHTLYGHLSLKDIAHLQKGQPVDRGDCIAHFGLPHENGDWPPHLHFQIIEDMQTKKGDYPGVCSIREKEFYQLNCPDADLVLDMMGYAT